MTLQMLMHSPMCNASYRMCHDLQMLLQETSS